MNRILEINPLIIISVLIVCAVVLCFAGLKTIRVWNALSGLVVGAGCGSLIYMFSGMSQDKGQIMVLGIAAVIGIIAALLKKTGSFIFSMVAVFWILNGIVFSGQWYIVAVYAAVSLLIAIATMIWLEPMLILITSLSGAFLAEFAAELICIINGWRPGYLILIVPAVAFVLGLITQSMVKSREIGKNEIQYSKKMKKENSMESEVEQARNILDMDFEPEPVEEKSEMSEAVAEQPEDTEMNQETNEVSGEEAVDKSTEKETSVEESTEKDEQDSDNDYEMVFVDIEK